MRLTGLPPRRATRLHALAKAKQTIEIRAHERFEREQDAYQHKQAQRQAQRDAGKKPRSREPTSPLPGPRDTDPANVTAESRLMPVSGGGFEQCYNAQASVDTDTMRAAAICRELVAHGIRGRFYGGTD